MAWGPGGVVKTFVRIYVTEVWRGGENLRENLCENTVKKMESEKNIKNGNAKIK